MKNDHTVEYSTVKKINFPKLTSFTLFPNPAKDFVQIALGDYMGKDARLVINNNLGVQLKQINVENISSKYFQIDLREFREGIYTVWVFVEGRKPSAVPLMIGK